MKNISFGSIKKNLYNKIGGYISEGVDIPNNDSALLRNLTESEIMQLQLEVYDSLMNESFDDKDIARNFINENMSLFNTININDLISENKKYSSVIGDKQEVDKIDESIHTLIQSSCKGYKKDSTDKISESYKALSTLTNFLCEEKKVEDKPDNSDDLITENFDKVIEMFGKRIEEEYGDILNESDNQILAKLLSSDFNGKTEIYESLKTSVVDSLNKLGENENYKSKAANSIKKINEIKIDEGNINKNIIELHTLKEQLS